MKNEDFVNKEFDNLLDNAFSNVNISFIEKQKVWNKLSKKLTIVNFFKFAVASFNIYYLSLFAISTTATVFILNKNLFYQDTKIKNINNNSTKIMQTKNNDDKTNYKEKTTINENEKNNELKTIDKKEVNNKITEKEKNNIVNKKNYNNNSLEEKYIQQKSQKYIITKTIINGDTITTKDLITE